MKGFLAVLLAVPAVVPAAAVPAAADGGFDRVVRPFVARHCAECHGEKVRKADLRLDGPAPDFADASAVRTWTRVLDQIRSGEMPPSKKPRPPAAEREGAVAWIASAVAAAEAERARTAGRTVLRRLNRVEYEATLRDLLELPHLEVRDLLPPDPEAHGFDTVAEALQISSIHVGRYLEAAEAALKEAAWLPARPEPFVSKTPGAKHGGLHRKSGETLVVADESFVFRQPNSAQTPWRLNSRVPVAGTYRFRLTVRAVHWEKGKIRPSPVPHVASFYATEGKTSRWLATRDLPLDRPGVVSFEARIAPDERMVVEIHTMTARGVKSSETHVGPAVGFGEMLIEGPSEPWPPRSYARLFGDLPPEPAWAPQKKGPPKPAKNSPWRAQSRNPFEDAERLLGAFLPRAFRRPVDATELSAYVGLVRRSLGAGRAFADAMETAYVAALCSPDFLCRLEKPGRLDGLALASRLSYFLWSSGPDDALLAAAREGRLGRPEDLDREVERLLSDPRAERFVENFGGQWLDLRRIDATQPDPTLYPEFDALLQRSMVEETLAALRHMLRHDLSIGGVVDSDVLFLNERLARHYGIPGVKGVEIRAVPRPAGSPRGGLLTQGSLLKVTANGTTTSPVTRGAWVLDRLLGLPAPPPPSEVPAVEPDLRGTTTLREQLAKHRNDPSCASCHVRIDPPGFALESFDTIGGWRDRYRALETGDPVAPSVHGRPVKYLLGPGVDATGEMAGRAFKDVRDFKALLLEAREQIARNLAERLIVYATGAPVRVADRPAVEDILARTRPSGHGLRSLVRAVVQSPPFLNK